MFKNISAIFLIFAATAIQAYQMTLNNNTDKAITLTIFNRQAQPISLENINPNEKKMVDSEEEMINFKSEGLNFYLFIKGKSTPREGSINGLYNTLPYGQNFKFDKAFEIIFDHAFEEIIKGGIFFVKTDMD